MWHLNLLQPDEQRLVDDLRGVMADAELCESRRFQAAIAQAYDATGARPD